MKKLLRTIGRRFVCFMQGHSWQYHCEIMHRYRGPKDPGPMHSQITGIQHVRLFRNCLWCLKHEQINCTWRTH